MSAFGACLPQPFIAGEINSADFDRTASAHRPNGLRIASPAIRPKTICAKFPSLPFDLILIGPADRSSGSVDHEHQQNFPNHHA